MSYLNTGLDVFDGSDDLYVAVEVDNAKQFIKGIGDTFKDTFISTENLDLFASFVDSTRGAVLVNSQPMYRLTEDWITHSHNRKMVVPGNLMPLQSG